MWGVTKGGSWCLFWLVPVLVCVGMSRSAVGRICVLCLMAAVHLRALGVTLDRTELNLQGLPGATAAPTPQEWGAPALCSPVPSTFPGCPGELRDERNCEKERLSCRASPRAEAAPGPRAAPTEPIFERHNTRTHTHKDIFFRSIFSFLFFRLCLSCSRSRAAQHGMWCVGGSGSVIELLFQVKLYIARKCLFSGAYRLH